MLTAADLKARKLAELVKIHDAIEAERHLADAGDRRTAPQPKAGGWCW